MKVTFLLFFSSLVHFLQGSGGKKKINLDSDQTSTKRSKNMTVSFAVAIEMPRGNATRKKKTNNEDHVSNEHNFILLKSARVGAKAHSLQGFRGAVNKARRG